MSFKKETKEYNKEVEFSAELKSRIKELMSRYPTDKKKSAMLPVLHAVQNAHDNWLSVPVMDKVAEMLGVTPIEVYEVVTFYTMFNEKPVGKYHLQFCRTACCALRKAEELIEYTCKKLNVGLDQVTEDGLFSVTGVECLAACGYGPMLQLGDFYHQELTKEKIDQLIEDCKQGKIKLH